jgi:pectin methylesterase-like acyl-CoA thioesterase
MTSKIKLSLIPIVIICIIGIVFINTLNAASSTHEAEASTNNFKYASVEGSYVAFDEKKDAYVEMKSVDSPSSETLVVTFVYSSTTSFPVELKVNGSTIVSNETFDSTNGSWVNKSISASMNSGTDNKIRFKIRAAVSGVKLDKVIISTDGDTETTTSDTTTVTPSTTTTASTETPTSTTSSTDYDIVVAKDGSGDYSTVQAAINAVPNNGSNWYTIYIKDGTYKEYISIPSTKTYLYLLGQSKDNTILTYDYCSSTAGGTSKSASITINSKNFKAENITFENSFDYDNSSLSNKQGVAVAAVADRQHFKNCNFLGHQDTLYVNNGRQYFENCFVQGVVDFIFGNGTAVFESSNIKCLYRSGGTGCITAPSTLASSSYGIVFIGCNVYGESSVSTGGYSLGRPWHPSSSTKTISSSTIYKSCTLSSVCGDWSDMSGVSWEGERFYEYQNSGDGAQTGSDHPQLSSSAASSCTVSSVLKGSDNWSPN